MSSPDDEPQTHNHMGYFGVEPSTLIDLVEAYRNRKFVEDLTYVEEKFSDVEKLADKLKSSLDHGLEGNDFQKRDEHFGSNEKEPPPRKGICKLFLEALDDLMLKILIVSAIISIIISMIFADDDERPIAWVEGGAILFAVAVVTGVTAWNDYQKEKQFMKLTEYSDSKNNFTVLRNGVQEEINFDDIKVGDLVAIRTGMNIPADAILIRGTGVTSDESAMTGESIELKKEPIEQCKMRLEEKQEEEKFHSDAPERTNHDIPSPILLSGTQIETGEGWFMVVVVGKESCVGKIYAKLSQEIETTPLQLKLNKIATDIGYLGMFSAAITLIVLFGRFFIEQSLDGWDGGDIGDYLEEWFEYILIAVTIVVVAVPEGLPLAVMIALAYSVRKMLKDQNFVKRLSSCEIMGGANNICSDKTGTLTKNEMTVKEMWVGGLQSLDNEQKEYTIGDYIRDKKHADLFLQGLSCNTSGTSKEANATEKAILKMLDKFGCDYQDLRGQHCKDPLTRFQFTSRRKKMSTVLTEIDDNEFGYDKRLHIKGAAEYVLANCTHYLNEQGERVELDPTTKNHLIKDVIKGFAEGALRTICCAYRDLKPEDGGLAHDEDGEDGVSKVVETFLTCICILGIRDVIRPEVPDAVEKCQNAGIRVRMVTGDNQDTALAIAKECNIIAEEKEDSIMTGPQFYERVGGLYCQNCNEDSPCKCPEKKVKEAVKNKKEFAKIHENLSVLARSRPEDKYLLVTGIKEMGDVVAVTGDGTNDAPALKKADVGFAMGITGTDVAKHAADIILLDDNFASIVQACMWGRNIYDNIRRFLQFQLSVNIVALTTAFIGSCILRESPLQPIQLLWVNLIMDSLGSLAEATERPTEKLLNRPPQSRDDYIISHKMVKHLIIMGTYQSIVVFVLIFLGEFLIPEDSDYHPNTDGKYVYPGRAYSWDGKDLYRKFTEFDDDKGPSRHYTVVFNAFVFMQIFNMI
mmetsp:Transcript_9465/g.9189  ORF Transcript_9465/g.9189 Transcript_9465/m.9189 type:complete len:973 (+) Transcript_9465:1130-4048(+)